MRCPSSIRKVLAVSESLATIAGTLFIGLGVNVLTGLGVLDDAAWAASDTLRMAIALPSAYTGCLLLLCSCAGPRLPREFVSV